MRIKTYSTGHVPSEYHINDKNDCAIRAIANVSSIPYPVLREKMIKLGRKPNRGTPWNVLDKVYKESGAMLTFIWGKAARSLKHYVKYNDVVDKSITLERFVKTFPKGRHIVLIRKHALAVVDGKIIDSGDNKAGARVIATYHFGE